MMNVMQRKIISSHSKIIIPWYTDFIKKNRPESEFEMKWHWKFTSKMEVLADGLFIYFGFKYETRTFIITIHKHWGLVKGPLECVSGELAVAYATRSLTFFACIDNKYFSRRPTQFACKYVSCNFKF